MVLAAYVGTIVTANWASTHCSALLVGAVAVPAGTLWAGVTFTLRDLLHECLGPRGVLAAIAAGAGLSWLLASPQIAVASVMAGRKMQFFVKLKLLRICFDTNILQRPRAFRTCAR